jgi:hypothetical protein
MDSSAPLCANSVREHWKSFVLARKNCYLVFRAKFRVQICARRYPGSNSNSAVKLAVLRCHQISESFLPSLAGPESRQKPRGSDCLGSGPPATGHRDIPTGQTGEGPRSSKYHWHQMDSEAAGHGNPAPFNLKFPACTAAPGCQRAWPLSESVSTAGGPGHALAPRHTQAAGAVTLPAASGGCECLRVSRGSELRLLAAAAARDLVRVISRQGTTRPAGGG